MQLKLGDKIRMLRRRDGRTQEELAEALGVTGQTVSRWEAGGGYPDMELVPPLANYFGVTIDELFGYDSDRDRRVKEYTDKYDAIEHTRGDTAAMLALMREAVAEFPSSEEILIRLAQALSDRGWAVGGARGYNTDESDYALNDGEYNSKNKYWQESLKLFDKLLASSDPNTRERVVQNAVCQHKLVGEYEKAIEIARIQPPMSNSREMLLAAATDGEERERYSGELIIRLTSFLSSQVLLSLTSRLSLAHSDVPVKKLLGMIDLFNLIFDDGRFGYQHLQLRELFLWLALYNWRLGDGDGAFGALDGALDHARKFAVMYAEGGVYSYTAPLVSKVEEDTRTYSIPSETLSVSSLPGMWQVREDMCPGLRADPRWDVWVEKTKT